MERAAPCKTVDPAHRPHEFREGERVQKTKKGETGPRKTGNAPRKGVRPLARNGQNKPARFEHSKAGQ